MTKLMTTLLAAGASLAFAGQALAAGGACPPGVPAGIFCGEPDASLAPAGTYALDAQHASVIARVPHMGYSISIFRFDKVTGTLTWDPASPAKSSVTATVETGFVSTNVAGFGQAISDKYLGAKANPAATFVSTAFRQTDATHGQVDGALTLMGKTRPVTFDVVLVGAGKGFGKPRIGMTATTSIKPGDFGMPPVFADPIALVIDAEFEQK
ncbi:MAG: polyisoprenoid-binding protein [Phenylobacterium sp.]|uniref:YceI family protein n=1 Tax=Phenylobacterium sp. TaxID=1871053 RepID=UPI001B5C54D9|nr:YceI family protein [Phenylobacterium sp.]MBP7650272.1 polyisoprenoid-binding protein [Phenylobacterium sp.]MBP7815935.1 polyisoprenoid-binding protein [Phenylobacterium sp.]MBP9230115.1 polyisoprenoid-binding protein [Phenylobacterium sp.]MBP9755002.1 polyisoprenoid-binding protein [Phenylobacterium sp.]